jgi:hypothetical protein
MTNFTVPTGTAVRNPKMEIQTKEGWLGVGGMLILPNPYDEFFINH